jgi:hypothetical protein
VKARAHRRLTARRRKFNKLHREQPRRKDFVDHLTAFGKVSPGTYPWWRVRNRSRDRDDIIAAIREGGRAHRGC